MGFLADVGRSNLLGQVMDYGRFVRQGETLRRQEAVTNQALQKGALELEDAKKKFEALHKKQPFESSILYQTTPEELRPKLLETARKGGYLDDRGMSKFDRDRMIEEDADFQKIWFGGQEMKAQVAVDKALTAYENAQLSGDQEKLKKADATMRAALARLAAVKNQASAIPGILGGKEKEDTTTKMKDFEASNPQFQGLKGTQEYGKAYNDWLLEQAQRITQLMPMYLDEGGNVVSIWQRGPRAGEVVSSQLPPGGTRTPVRPGTVQEGDTQTLTAVSNITEVLPDVKEVLDLRLKSGAPLTNFVTGKAWNAALDRGISYGIPPEAVKTHAAIKHLNTWAMNVLRGAGAESQREALQETFPTLWDSPEIMQNKLKKTLQITRNVMNKRISAMRASNRPVPPSAYEDLQNVDNFISAIGDISKPSTEAKQLDRATASEILREAGGDKEKARAIAKERGYKF